MTALRIIHHAATLVIVAMAVVIGYAVTIYEPDQPPSDRMEGVAAVAVGLALALMGLLAFGVWLERRTVDAPDQPAKDPPR